MAQRGTRGGPLRGQRGGGRGRARGGPPPRVGGPEAGLQTNLPASHINTIGVKRRDFGKAGRTIKIVVNAIPTSIPDGTIYHYDVDITPADRAVYVKIIKFLQCEAQSAIFTPRIPYDGNKNMFSTSALALGPSNARQFSVTPFPAAPGSTRPPKVYTITVTLVNTVNLEMLSRFIAGTQALDNSVQTSLNALNVALRMAPSQKYPFRGKSFYSNAETVNIGKGLQLWRGYFQSLRPAIGRLLINIDISTGMMYKPGPLIDLCLEYTGMNQPNMLAQMHPRARHELQRFIMHCKIRMVGQQPPYRLHTIQAISGDNATKIYFRNRQGQQMSVAQYFQSTNRALRFPMLPCVRVSATSWLPLEACIVPEGQICRKQVPPEVQSRLVDFSTKKPSDRLSSIRKGLEVFNYAESSYVRDFGMIVEGDNYPLKTQARVLGPPELKYGTGSKVEKIRPAHGAWNMIDKKLFRPSTVKNWFVVIYENERRFDRETAKNMVRDLVKACGDVGVSVVNPQPEIHYENSQDVVGGLERLGMAYFKKTNAGPELVIVVLPENGNDIYKNVKFFGDVKRGVVTQCVISSKAKRAKPQYWANVLLKLNAKLGGVNHVVQDNPILSDQRNPVLVIGADVMHPAPGTEGIPSFAALVSSVNGTASKYVAIDSVQASRQEIIPDLEAMVKAALAFNKKYREIVEKDKSEVKKLFFFRDGVAETQFAEVLSSELAMIKSACRGFNVNPAITFIVVGKRHHYRLFPENERDGDRSGNCPAGTVLDTDITHPTDSDFYLQSHGGLLGTSRSAHYSVLYDDNKMTADAMQQFSFAMCHSYARSTRSVSIPAPVYYADIVCARAKTRFDPSGNFQNIDDGVTDVGTVTSDKLQPYKDAYMPLHASQQTKMFFV